MLWKCFIKAEKKLKPQSANSQAHERFSLVNCSIKVNKGFVCQHFPYTDIQELDFFRLNTCFLHVPSLFSGQDQIYVFLEHLMLSVMQEKQEITIFALVICMICRDLKHINSVCVPINLVLLNLLSGIKLNFVREMCKMGNCMPWMCAWLLSRKT